MEERKELSFHLTEEGDLHLFGDMPDYPSPEAAPWYPHRTVILRVVSHDGARIGENAFAEYPALRVADLLGCRSVGARAFAACPRLRHVVLSAEAASLSSSALSACPSLLTVDFSGTRTEWEALGHALPSGAFVRTAKDTEGAPILEGEVGGGSFSLYENGVLAVRGACLPDYRHPQDSPFFPIRHRITALFFDESVTRIGERCFTELPSLTELCVAGRAYISPFAFASCRALKDAALFASVTEVGAYALAGTGIEEAIMPPSCRYIPEGLYDSCPSLRSLLLPAVPTAETKPFTENCRSLSHLIFVGTREDFRALKKSRKLSAAKKRPVLYLSAGAAVEKALDRVAKAYRSAMLSSLDCAEGRRELASLLGSLSSLLTDAETAHSEAMARRLGFVTSPSPEKDGKGRRHRREAKSAARTAKASACAEIKAEKRTARAAVTACDATARALARESRLLKVYARRHARVVSAWSAAERSVHALYPYGQKEAERLARLAPEKAGLPAAERSLPYDEALLECRVLRGILPYYRYEEAAERARVLLEHLFPSGKGEEARTPSAAPRILVAGALGGDDGGALACMQLLRSQGAVPILATGGEDDLGYDALLLCDGPPTDPYLYNERRKSIYKKNPPILPSVARDRRDNDLFRAFYFCGKPILGIGRGCEFINALTGGSQRRILSDGQRALHGATGATVHELTVRPSSFLYSVYRPTVRQIRVISRHSSVIRTLGKGFLPVAKAKDGSIEAIAHRTLPVYGVAFNPECMLKTAPRGTAFDDGTPLFSWFCELTKELCEAPLTEYTRKRLSSYRKK